MVPRAHSAAIPHLLWVTDRTQCGGRTLDQVTREFLEGAQTGGLSLGVLLREKDLSGKALYEQAQVLRRTTQDYGATFLISGRIDVAAAVHADGVHLPQNDLPPAVARELLSEGLLGVSCHSQAEVVAACAGGADYVTFGPVYDTPSKRAYGPPVGLEALTRACTGSDGPVLGLGGISLDNGAAVFEAGAHGLAFISAIAAAESPAHAAAEFASLAARYASGGLKAASPLAS